MISGPSPLGAVAHARGLPLTHPSNLEAIFERYAPYVAAIAIHILGREEEIDDVIQEVFVEAAGGLHRLRQPEALKGWLATTAVRLCRRRLRQKRFWVLLGLRPQPYDEAAWPEAEPEERILLRRVYAALDEVPANQRIAWTLRHLEGEKLEAIAELCNCSLATAKRWITAAQEAIKAKVSDEERSSGR